MWLLIIVLCQLLYSTVHFWRSKQTFSQWLMSVIPRPAPASTRSEPRTSQPTAGVDQSTPTQTDPTLLGVDKHPVAPSTLLNQSPSSSALPTPILTLQSWDDIRRALCGYQTPLPEFSGLSHEDPQRYLRRCEAYIAAYQIPADDCTRTLTKGLIGDARTWWRDYETFDLEWQRFNELLLLTYDSGPVRTKLLADLYGRKQAEDQPVAVFLLEKHALFHRLRPEESEDVKVTVLLNQIRPSLRKYVRAADPKTFSQLLAITMEIERDDEEEAEMRTSPALPIKATKALSRASTARPRAPTNPDLVKAMSRYKSEVAARAKASRTSAIAVQHQRRTKPPVWVDLPDEAFPPSSASAQEFIALSSGQKVIPINARGDQEVARPSSLCASPIDSSGDRRVAAPISSLCATPIHSSGNQKVVAPTNSLCATPNFANSGLRVTASPFYSNYSNNCGLEAAAPFHSSRHATSTFTDDNHQTAALFSGLCY